MMSASVLKTMPGKLDIKRHSPSFLYLLRMYVTCVMGATQMFINSCLPIITYERATFHSQSSVSQTWIETYPITDPEIIRFLFWKMMH